MQRSEYSVSPSQSKVLLYACISFVYFTTIGYIGPVGEQHAFQSQRLVDKTLSTHSSSQQNNRSRAAWTNTSNSPFLQLTPMSDCMQDLNNRGQSQTSAGSLSPTFLQALLSAPSPCYQQGACNSSLLLHNNRTAPAVVSPSSSVIRLSPHSSIPQYWVDLSYHENGTMPMSMYTSSHDRTPPRNERACCIQESSPVVQATRAKGSRLSENNLTVPQAVRIIAPKDRIEVVRNKTSRGIQDKALPTKTILVSSTTSVSAISKTKKDKGSIKPEKTMTEAVLEEYWVETTQNVFDKQAGRQIHFPWVPPGYAIEIRFRQTGYDSGRHYFVFHTPNGRRLRSIKQIEEHYNASNGYFSSTPVPVS